MKDRPNVLFLIVDDLRPQLGCYGQAQMHTPNLDRLAKRSVRFDRHYCQQAICGPSRNHIMSGCRPDTVGIYDLGTRLRDQWPEVRTLPQHFKENGYTTRWVGKVYHHPDDDRDGWTDALPAENGGQVGRGYLHPDSIEWMYQNMAKLKAAGSHKSGLGPAFERGPDDVPYVDELNTDAAVAALDESAREPWFLAVGFQKPHLPFSAPKRFWDLYDPQDIVVPDEQPPRGSTRYSLTTYGELRDYHGIPDEGPIPSQTARQLIHGYNACVSYLDAQIGRVIDALERSGQADHTVVVFCVDHGMKLGEHGAWSKHTLYEIDNRVPLMIAAPGVEPATTAALTENIDIYPTLCDLCGLDTPTQVDGVSLKPWLDDSAHPGKPAAYSQYPRGEQVMGYAVRTTRFRYIEWRQQANGNVLARELYDHHADPGEHQSVIDDPAYARELPELQALLNAPSQPA